MKRYILVCVAVLAWIVQAQAPPQRVVSLVPSVTEMLFAIGAGPRVIGVGSFDQYPREVVGLPRVGGLLDPNTEAILALHPDLVIIYATQVDLKSRLERAGVPMFAYAHGGLADVTDTIRRLGTLLGLADRARAVAADLEAKIEAIRARVGRARRPRVLVVFGREAGSLRNLYASGGIGFIQDMLAAAGGDNVFADVQRESVQATTELILARAPEVIVELKPESFPESQRAPERAVWKRLSAVPAVQSDRIYLLVGDEFVVPGPRVAAGTEKLARALHPEVF